ncbi:hypothetical protein MK280_13595 [Myxococcota bacterium]|nr:hypothetical protein [Myxococcota bacterium]
MLGAPGAPVASGCPDAENPCCADPATDVSFNACFASVNQKTLEPGFAPAQAGVLVHGWDGTEAEGTPWIPGPQQGPAKRWSSSYIDRLNISSGNPNSEGQTGSCTVNTAPDQRVICDEMQALSEKVGVNVPLLWLNPTDLEQPFAEACANWSECQEEGAHCQALVGS